MDLLFNSDIVKPSVKNQWGRGENILFRAG